MIVASLLVLDVAQRWLTETIKFRLREGLTGDLFKLWMAPRRAFWLATGGGHMGVNPDQRMSEDAAKLCDISGDLSVGLFRSGVLFVSFAGVLWAISADFTFRFGDVDYAVPGFMVWAAISYAAVGSLLSYFVGRKLIGRNADRYAPRPNCASRSSASTSTSTALRSQRARPTSAAASKCISATS